MVLTNGIKDSITIDSNQFNPRILTIFKNIGVRYAENLLIRPFIVYNDFSDIRGGILPYKSRLVDPNVEMTFAFTPKIDFKEKDNFYYCYEVIYYDRLLNKEFRQAYYYHYYKSRGKYTFNTTSNDDEERIRTTINKKLKLINERLFDK